MKLTELRLVLLFSLILSCLRVIVIIKCGVRSELRSLLLRQDVNVNKKDMNTYDEMQHSCGIYVNYYVSHPKLKMDKNCLLFYLQTQEHPVGTEGYTLRQEELCRWGL